MAPSTHGYFKCRINLCDLHTYIHLCIHADGPRDALARALLAWFKHEFFRWTNNAPCEHCGSGSTVNAGQTGYVCVYVNACVCMFVCVCVCVLVCEHCGSGSTVNAGQTGYVCVYVNACVCMYVCMYVCACM
jgi:hypothetical protein